jgi:hypothetical protein
VSGFYLSTRYWPNVVTMMSTPDFEALELLRALFDLADADVRPTLDLLGRLLHLEPGQCSALIAQLRVARLLQNDRLCLTTTEPRPMSALVVPAARNTTLRAA